MRLTKEQKIILTAAFFGALLAFRVVQFVQDLSELANKIEAKEVEREKEFFTRNEAWWHRKGKAAGNE